MSIKSAQVPSENRLICHCIKLDRVLYSFMKCSASDGFKSLSISWSLLSDVMSNISILPTYIISFTYWLINSCIETTKMFRGFQRNPHRNPAKWQHMFGLCGRVCAYIMALTSLLSISLLCLCFVPGRIDHSLLQLLLNSPEGLARAMLSRTVCQDTVKSSIIGQKDWPQVSDLMSILKQLGAFLVGEASFTGSCATELIRFCLCWYQALSPTVTLCKWWILYPLIESWVHLISAGLEHSWRKPLFLTHHLKPLACLLGLSVTAVSTHELWCLGAGRAVAASEVASTSLHISANSLQTSAAVQHGTWWLGASVRSMCACVHESWLGQPVTG